MKFLKKIFGFVTNTEEVVVRNRNEKGQFVADDKSTKNKNEAYKTVRRKKTKSKK